MAKTIEQLKQGLREYIASKNSGNSSQNNAPVENPVVSRPVDPQIQKFKEGLAAYDESRRNGAPMFSNKPVKKEGGGVNIGEMAKDIVRAPATMIARPFQLAYELATPGDNFDEIDKFSRENLGGIVAPLPRDNAGLKKDIGRGVQTIALGTGAPIAGGAAFGVGSSLEQGNDLLSAETAANTALGAVGGKVLDVVGKPLFNVAGKAVSKIAPPGVKNAVSKGAGAVQDFAEKTKLFGGAAAPLSKSIEKGFQSVDDGIGKATTAVIQPVKGILPKSENLMTKASGLTPSQRSKFKQQFGEDAGTYLDNTKTYKHGEKLVKDQAEKLVSSMKEADDTLSQIPGVHKNEYVERQISALQRRMEKVQEKGPDTKRIKELFDKYQKEGLTHAEINEVKRLYERKVQLKFKREKKSIPLERATNLATNLRKWQDAEAKKYGFSNLPEINRQTQKAKFMVDNLGRNLDKELEGAALDLGDLILLGGMTPETITLAVARKLWKSPGLKTKAASLFSKSEKVPFTKAKYTPTKPRAPLQLPGKGQSSYRDTYYTTPKGKTSLSLQDAADAAARESGKIKTPEITKAGVERLKKAYEQAQKNTLYKPAGEMSIIEFGKLPRTPSGAIDISKLTPPQVINLREFIKKVERYIPDNELPSIRF